MKEERVENQIAEYGNYLNRERHSSPNTITSYLRDVNQFRNYLITQQHCDLPDAAKDTIQFYMFWMVEQGRSTSTAMRSLAALRSFYGFLQSKGDIRNDPSCGIISMKVERKCPEVLTAQEIELFLEQPQCVDAKGYRDHAMLELLYATGIRVSELIALDVDHVDLTLGIIRCQSKGRERNIPLYRKALEALDDYMNIVRPYLVSDSFESALFLNLHNGKRISRQGFWKIVKMYQKKAGIQKDITPHMLRHSFAVHLLENGADLHSIQKMMGHADISSTQFYARVAARQMKDMYQKAQPMAQTFN